MEEEKPAKVQSMNKAGGNSGKDGVLVAKKIKYYEKEGLVNWVKCNWNEEEDDYLKNSVDLMTLIGRLKPDYSRLQIDLNLRKWRTILGNTSSKFYRKDGRNETWVKKHFFK